MTMLSKHLAVGVWTLAVLGLVSSARAEDSVRLGLSGPPTAPTINLKGSDADLNADMLDVGRGGGSRGGAFRGGAFRGSAFRGSAFRGSAFRGVGFRGVGFRGVGFRGVAIRGHRGGFWGGSRGYWGSWGGWGGSWGSTGWYPSYWGWGGSPLCYTYYNVSPWYSGFSGWGSPCSGGTVIGSVPTMPPASLSTVPTPAVPLPAPVPSPSADPTLGTFPYDGGPVNPVPTPRVEETPVRLPHGPSLIEDFVVSLPEKAGKWNYPAYGEKPTRNAPALKTAVITSALR
jgi:hypothetical protein